MLDIQQLKENLESVRLSYSEDAVNIIESLIDTLSQDESVDFNNALFEEVASSSVSIYYSSAFDYLRDQWITDFNDAIRNGFGGNVCHIAGYYLEEECYELASKIGVC